MKRKIKVWFPVWETYEDEVEVDIPDDDDPEEWLDYDTKLKLIEEHWMSESSMDSALEFGHAGAKFVDRKDPQ